MKKFKLMLFAAFLFVTVFANAQTEYVWDDYGVGFAVTEDFDIRVSNRDKFSAVSSDGLIDIEILPWLDGSINEADLEDAVIDYASDICPIADDILVDDLRIDDFTGKYLAAQLVDGEMILVACMLDTQSRTNIIVLITFEEGNEDEAVDILESFYAYD
ncbi:hypothetical protein [Seonamhaeicola sp.]|uniref:hypothetical protein n=1 Tax=Seonamhaeicola sp. TaxID=1912245 RepID=UPI00262380BB|nr:hypothetical protein [Seonamhaeicola sp.]